jgi:hypothetical protein
MRTMTRNLEIMIVCLSLFAACSASENEPRWFNEFDKDYSIQFEQRMYLNDTLTSIDTCLIGQRDSLQVLLSEQSTSLQTKNWSLSAIHASRLALYRLATKHEGYFYAPDNMVNILRYAHDNSDSLQSRELEVGRKVMYHFRRNGLGLDEVCVEYALDGTIRRISSSYIVSESTIKKVFTVLRRSHPLDAARLDEFSRSVALEEGFHFVLKGPLEGYNIMRRPI